MLLQYFINRYNQVSYTVTLNFKYVEGVKLVLRMKEYLTSTSDHFKLDVFLNTIIFLKMRP